MRMRLVHRGKAVAQWVVVAAIITLALVAGVTLLGTRANTKLNQTATGELWRECRRWKRSSDGARGSCWDSRWSCWLQRGSAPAMRATYRLTSPRRGIGQWDTDDSNGGGGSGGRTFPSNSVLSRCR